VTDSPNRGIRGELLKRERVEKEGAGQEDSHEYRRPRRKAVDSRVKRIQLTDCGRARELQEKAETDVTRLGPCDGASP